MNFDTVVLAEGVTTDSRGAFTVVGLNQRVIALRQLPTQVRLTLLAIFSDEADDQQEGFASPARNIKVAVTLRSPSGSVMFAATSGPVPQAPKQWQDLPGFGNFIVDLPLVAETTGVHRVEIDLEEDNAVVDRAAKRIYVVRASTLNASTSDSTQA
jgi:hypothetical protein